jgi:hypothetical protein
VKISRGRSAAIVVNSASSRLPSARARASLSLPSRLLSRRIRSVALRRAVVSSRRERGVLQRVLGGVEIAQFPDQGGQHLPPGAPEQRIQSWTASPTVPPISTLLTTASAPAMVSN